MKYTNEQIMQLAKEGRVWKLHDLKTNLRHSKDVERKAFIEEQITVAENVAAEKYKQYKAKKDSFEPTIAKIKERLESVKEVLKEEFPELDIKLCEVAVGDGMELSVSWLNHLNGNLK